MPMASFFVHACLGSLVCMLRGNGMMLLVSKPSFPSIAKSVFFSVPLPRGKIPLVLSYIEKAQQKTKERVCVCVCVCV